MDSPMDTTPPTATPASSSTTPGASSDSSAAPATRETRPSMNGRLPSLNQLAVRMSIKDGAPHLAGAPRPRLAASFLRTQSNMSLSGGSTTSLADSTAVNPPSSRSESPAPTASSPGSYASSAAPSEIATDDIEPLTAEHLEAHNAAAADGAAAPTEPAAKKPPKGYKNIPSLDAIARLVKARTLSIDGSEKPPEPETYEDPKTPGIPMKAPEHPLQNNWTIFHDSKSKVPFTPAVAPGEAPVPFTPHSAADSGAYEAGLTVIGEFDTVESFCRYFNWLKPPSKLERNSNYHLFKSGIKPMWEDPANANGGKWVLTMKNNPELLDRSWSWLSMALVGEEMDEEDEICGAVVSLRAKVDRIQLWVRSKDEVEKVNSIGKKLVKVLGVSEADSIGLEFQYNTDDRPLPNKFLSIQSVPQSTYRSTFQGSAASPVAGPGEGPPSASGFGNFQWRGSKRA